jgi:hypothetical protein
MHSQLRAVPWLHTLRAPARPEQVQRLPLGLQPLYEKTDGIDIHHLMFQGEIVGTVLEVLRADEVVPIDQAMYGSVHQLATWLGREWLAVARASDSAFFIAMDARHDTFYSVSPIAKEEAEPIASSTSEFFVWLLGSLPTEQQLKVAAQHGAA